MKSRIWMFLILLTCATAAFGQTGAPATQEDDGSTPERQMCVDCDLNSGGGWWQSNEENNAPLNARHT